MSLKPGGVNSNGLHSIGEGFTPGVNCLTYASTHRGFVLSMLDFLSCNTVFVADGVCLMMVFRVVFMPNERMQ